MMRVYEVQDSDGATIEFVHSEGIAQRRDVEEGGRWTARQVPVRDIKKLCAFLTAYAGGAGRDFRALATNPESKT